MPIGIVTDSSCDLPAEILRGLPVTVVPLSVEVNGKQYVEGVTIDAPRFADEMKLSRNLPRTSQPSPQAFLEAFEKATHTLGEATELLCITLSSKLSGTFNSARIAQGMFKGKVTVVDSLSGTLGLGLMALNAARWAKNGLSLEQVHQRMLDAAQQTSVLVGLDTLENVVKGGRINRAVAPVAELLHLKIFVHTTQGKVELHSKVRGKARVLGHFLKTIAAKGGEYASKSIGISHVANEADALALAQAINERFAPKEIIIAPMGSTIATYAGPGAVGVAY